MALIFLSHFHGYNENEIFADYWDTYWVIQNDCGQVWQLCTKIYVATM
jgi:hypothetical protein